MNILITGGAGYVGSACLRHLLRRGHEPFAFDNLAEGNREAVPGTRLIVGDICDPAALDSAFTTHQFDAVLHCAAVASVPESLADPARYWHVNTFGTRCVLEAMRRHGVRRIVFSSTAATYGSTTTMPLTEDSDQRPVTPYGTSKLACEWLIEDYARAYGFGYTHFRYFNASGADPDGAHGECRRVESHLIPLILASALGRRPPVRIFGVRWPTRDGTCVRDYVHVLDLAEAHRLALEKLEPGMGRSYCLGSGSGTTVLEVMRTCERIAGVSIPFQVAAERPGDPAELFTSPGRAKRELGWLPLLGGIDDIVRTAWLWHSAHPNGYSESPTPAAVPAG